MSKEYTINHISDILDIPEEKFDHFLIDLKSCYEASKNMREIMLVCGDKQSNEEFLKEIVWIDDDKHDGKIQITVTGEENE